MRDPCRDSLRMRENMTETYVCKECCLECKIIQKSEMEKQFPTICPHGMLPHYDKPPFKRLVRK